MVKNCSNCGRTIEGEVVAPGWQSALHYFDGANEGVMGSGRDIGFCCSRCAWQYGIESHKIYGMSGKDVRRHLVEMHGLIPG